MDDRNANIDLLFRNGLKDYEVLPPQEIWDKIQPAVKKRPYLFFLRYAAAIAIISCLGFMTWLLSHDVTPRIGNSFAVLNITRSEPVRIAAALTDDIEMKTQPDYRQSESVIIQKAEYNSEIAVLNDVVSENAIIQRRSYIIHGPEKADFSPVSQNINIENDGNNFPGFYKGEKPAERRWSISAMASPTYYSKTGKGDEDIMQMSSFEKSAPSYAGGVGLSYKISRRFSIQTGFYYSGYGQKINGVSSYSGLSRYAGTKGSSEFEIMTTNGPVRTAGGDIFLKTDSRPGLVNSAYNNDSFDPAKANLDYFNNTLVQTFEYIQMPVFLRYKLIDRNIDLNLLGGVSYDFLIGNTAFAKNKEGKLPVGNTEGLNSLLFSSSLGMGVEYNFSEKVSLNFEPTFRYFVNPFNDAAGTRVHPYSFGVFSGISYKF